MPVKQSVSDDVASQALPIARLLVLSSKPNTQMYPDGLYNHDIRHYDNLSEQV